MGTKYATVTVSGYNASPPADDGSTSASNQVKWDTIKTKLPDPLNTALAAINSGLVSAFDYSARSITTGDTTIASDHMRTIEVAPTVSSVVTINLGDAATMAASYTVNIVNRSNFTAVIGRATASDTINAVAANDALNALSAVTYKVNSTSNGYVTVGNTATAPTSAQGASLVLITRQTVSTAVASVDFTSGISSAYDEYLITITNATPATNNVTLRGRISQSGVFKSGANYTTGATTGGTSFNMSSSAGTGIDNTAVSGGIDGEVRIFAPSSAAVRKKIMWQMVWRDGTTGNVTPCVYPDLGGSYVLDSTAIDGFQFLMSSGNINSGTFSLYGIKKA